MASSESVYRLPNGIEVGRDSFLENRNRTAYPGPGGLLFVERIAGDCFLIEQDGIVVDSAPSKSEAERRIADFHRLIAEEERQMAVVEKERRELKEERRRQCENRRWPIN